MSTLAFVRANSGSGCAQCAQINQITIHPQRKRKLQNNNNDNQECKQYIYGTSRYRPADIGYYAINRIFISLVLFNVISNRITGDQHEMAILELYSNWQQQTKKNKKQKTLRTRKLSPDNW